MKEQQATSITAADEAAERMRWGYWFARYLCQWFSVMYLRARVHGRRHLPRRGAVLLVCNHQSFMDPVLATIAPTREGNYMARESLFKNPFFGRLIAWLNAYPVKRGEADIGAIKETLRRLKQGRMVLVFPEGRRSDDGRLQPLLPGIGAIAKKARVPIVPILIDGMTQAWPPRLPLPRPGDVIVEYGPAMQPEEYADLSADELLAELARRLAAMQRRWHGLLPERRIQWFEDQHPPESS